MDLTIYHNPTCSTSRKVLGFIREAGIEPKIILYLKDPLSAESLQQLLLKLEIGPRALLRKKGTPYEELGLSDKNLSDTALIEAMVQHPILIERPILETTYAAVLCRPPERAYELLAKK
jgi:arsenate reductase